MLELHTTCKSLLSENECGQVKTIRNLKTENGLELRHVHRRVLYTAYQRATYIGHFITNLSDVHSSFHSPATQIYQQVKIPD